MYTLGLSNWYRRSGMSSSAVNPAGTRSFTAAVFNFAPGSPAWSGAVVLSSVRIVVAPRAARGRVVVNAPPGLPMRRDPPALGIRQPARCIGTTRNPPAAMLAILVASASSASSCGRK